MNIIRFAIRRLVFIVLTLLALSLIVFYTTTFFPPTKRVSLYVPDSPYNHPGMDVFSKIQELIEKYRLNDPFYIQYYVWIRGVLQGNLGYSYLYNTSVMKAILPHFAATVELVMYAAPITFLGGYRLSVFLAKRTSKKAPRDDAVDFAVRTVSITAYSIPQFCIALLLLVVFYMYLGWFGLGRLGNDASAFVHSSDWTYYTGLYTIDALLNGELWIFSDAVRHLVLPVATLAIGLFPIIMRITRSAMLGELVMPYIVMAKAKGLDGKAVSRHAERNSLTSVLTVSGILFASMLTGVVVTEYVFSIHGLGYLTVKAAQKLDYPLLVGLSIMFCLIFAVINMMVEIAYAYIDPRVSS